MANLPFTITDLNSKLGAYYRENSGKIFLDAIYRPEDSKKTTAWDLMEKEIVWDEKSFATADFDPKLQDAANPYSDQGAGVTIGGKLLKARYGRSDFKMDVQGLYNSWLSHIEKEAYHNRVDKGDMKASEIAFGRWVIDNYVIKIIEKYRLQTSFKGIYAAGYNDTASFPSAADGFLKQITDAITATDIPAGQVVASGGAITSANAFTHMEELGEAVAEKFYYKEMVMFCSVKNARNYNKAFKTANNGNNPLIYGGYNRMQLESADNVSIIPVPEMGVSDRIFVTTPKNPQWGNNFDTMKPEIYTSVGEDPMKINVTIRYGAAMGFKRLDHIYTNDQA